MADTIMASPEEVAYHLVGRNLQSVPQDTIIKVGHVNQKVNLAKAIVTIIMINSTSFS